jgi:hypothetical protein
MIIEGSNHAITISNTDLGFSCTFNDDLQKEFKFIKLGKLCTDGTKVVCQHCNVHFSVVNGARIDINQHLCSQKHKEAKKTW